jgi:hypothetical protein
MGGQACVFYGAAEFSRDCDIVLLAEDENLVRLQSALDHLKAECIAVPPFHRRFLNRGHAVHFRCFDGEAAGIRLDVMTKMRGVDDFDQLWQRRTTLQDDAGLQYEILGIEDLVLAKKTQRDKDWPMIRRLVESHYTGHKREANDDRLRFWLRESRTPEMLIELASGHKNLANELVSQRGLLSAAIAGNREDLQRALIAEQEAIKEADRRYWQPLKQELELLRRDRPSKRPTD